MNASVLRKVLLILLATMLLIAMVQPIVSAYGETALDGYFLSENTLQDSSGTGKYLSYAASYALIEQTSGQKLKSGNENSRLPMASTTKTMTALIVLEHCRLDELVSVPSEAV